MLHAGLNLYCECILLNRLGDKEDVTESNTIFERGRAKNGHPGHLTVRETDTSGSLAKSVLD